MLPARRSLTPQEVIGAKYRIVRLLGRGGCGRVYEAENTWTGRRVALKLLNPPEESGGPDALRRFRQEAQAASLLRHPNIVDVLDMGVDAALRRPFMVQELLEGKDLGTLMTERGGGLPAEECLAIIAPVMRALAFAHARGVVHRDVKPDNIFLTQTVEGCVPKLIDFGIARLTPTDAPSRRTRSGLLLGTPFYMSPEQVRGDGSLDGRSDVWSVGVVLYEMLSGERPFTARTTTLLLTAILRDAPRPLGELAPALPRALCNVVMRAIAKERDDRWPTMQAFIDALDDARAGDAPEVELIDDPTPLPLSRPVTAERVEHHLAAPWRVGLAAATALVAVFTALALRALVDRPAAEPSRAASVVIAPPPAPTPPAPQAAPSPAPRVPPTIASPAPAPAASSATVRSRARAQVRRARRAQQAQHAQRVVTRPSAAPTSPFAVIE